MGYFEDGCRTLRTLSETPIAEMRVVLNGMPLTVATVVNGSLVVARANPDAGRLVTEAIDTCQMRLRNLMTDARRDLEVLEKAGQHSAAEIANIYSQIFNVELGCEAEVLRITSAFEDFFRDNPAYAAAVEA